MIAVALALVCFSWLVTTTLASFAFVTVLNQNDEHVSALTGLLEEGQDQPRDHDAQGALARAQATLARGQTRLTAA